MISNKHNLISYKSRAKTNFQLCELNLLPFGNLKAHLRIIRVEYFIG